MAVQLAGRPLAAHDQATRAQALPVLDTAMTGTGFRNPIIGPGGVLHYPQIQSVNWVPGVSGWRIGRDGTGEIDITLIRHGFGAGKTYVFALNRVMP